MCSKFKQQDSDVCNSSEESEDVLKHSGDSVLNALQQQVISSCSPEETSFKVINDTVRLLENMSPVNQQIKSPRTTSPDELLY